MLTNSISANAPNEANSGTCALLVMALASAKTAGTTTAADTARLSVTSPGSWTRRNVTGCRRPGRGGSPSPALAPPGAVAASGGPDRTDMVAVFPGEGGCGHPGRRVPYTGTAAPETRCAAGEARNRYACATSAILGQDAWSASGIALRLAGVSMMLGTTQFTVMPVPRTSAAAMVTRCSTPSLLTE